MDQAQVQQIPGMIEPNEQALLYNILSSIGLDDGDNIVEFGTFFGRSTNCLAQGLLANPSFSSSNTIYAYDSFHCTLGGSFAGHVINFAKHGGVESLLDTNANDLDFKAVFEHYNRLYIDREVIAPIQEELIDSHPPHGKIAFMHIDSPKYYEEFKTVLFRFFPYLKPGAVVVFQDYFYHWSASLIAAVMVMKNIELVSLELSAASSLVVKVLRQPSLQDITEIDLFMNRKSQMVPLLEQAIKECENIQVDRAEQFVPRVYLALFQILWESGDFEQAKALVVRFFNNGFKMNQSVVNDYIEMLGKGFSDRQLYEKDHS